MRKISALVVAAAMVVAASDSTMAAGINSAEQSVLDELNKTVKMNGTTMAISDSDINSAKNYFNTIEMTDAQASKVVNAIKKGEALLDGSKVSNIEGLSWSDKNTLLSYGQEAVSAVDLTMTYDVSNKKVVIKDANNNVVFENAAALVAVSNNTPGDNSGSGTNSGNTNNGGSTNGGKTDPNAVKTTGTNVNTSAVAGASAAAVLMAAAGATYVVKSRKERA